MTSTMSPQEFHDLMAEAVSEGPSDAALRSGAGADVTRGRRLLRRRRAAASGAAALALVVAGSGVALGRGSGGPTRADDGVASTPAPPAVRVPLRNNPGLLRACHDGNQSKRDTARIFGAGTPVLEDAQRTAYQVLAVLRSADGRYWAECFVHQTDQEVRSGMTVSSTTNAASGFGYSSGPACALRDGQADAGCRTFYVAFTDRRPSAVAAVEVELGDGRTVRVVPADGYVVVNAVGQLPEGVETTADGGWSPGFEALRRVTFLDAEGTPIAAQAFDGSGTGSDSETVADLPPLAAYPVPQGPGAD